mmetsp:Transcript_59393/g.66460  ORF Transcript_59393/g.66460 Transcript_59393/m.66460 type:complete len:329 (+) Transcript_59393:71-1057(+)
MANTMATKTIKKKLVLHTFPPVPNSYSFSPFGLKVESFLRINTIPYETLYTSSFGKNKTIPYLRIFESDQNKTDDSNAFDEVSDSNEIIAFLLTNPEYDTSLCEEENLTREQQAISHSCLRMLEEHTAQTGFYYRYNLNMPEFCEATQVRERVFMGDESKMGNMIFGFFKKSLAKGWDKKAAARGYMRYSSPDVVWAMACEDLQALEDLLASTPEDQTYFFGRAHPGVLDCTVFGHLSQFLYIAIDFPQKIYLQENCPTLLRFMERFKETHFPDWETLCQRQPNDGLRADNPRVLAMQKKMKHKALSAMAVMVGVVSVVYQIYRKHSK